MLTELQKKTAKAIVNIFETGRPLGDYSKVTLLQGDTGHLTYGRSQTTLASDNLYLPPGRVPMKMKCVCCDYRPLF
jgi:chitosanase